MPWPSREVEHGVGDHVAHLAFPHAADLARALDGRGRLGDDAGADLLQRGGGLGDAVQRRLVLGHGGVDQDRLAGGGDDLTCVVEGDHQFAEVLAVGVGLHDGGVADHRRVRPLGALHVAQKRVGVPAHDHVHASGVLGHALVDVVGRVAEDDDLVHALLCQPVHLRLHGLDRIGEDDVGAGGGELVGVLGREADQADALAADLDHGALLDGVRQDRLAAHIGVGHQDGELDRVHEVAQDLGAVVELVVADGHGVVAERVHHLGRQRALVVVVEQRALELIAPVHQEHVVAGAVLGVADRGDEAGGAAEALAGGVVLGIAGAVVLADRLEAGVEVVGVEDGEVELGMGEAGGERRRRGRRRRR